MSIYINTFEHNDLLLQVVKTCKVLKLVVLCLCVCLIGLVVCGAASMNAAQEKIVANRLRIVDQNGNVRIDIGHDQKRNLSYLNMFDQKGNHKIALDVDPKGVADLSFLKNGGKYHLRLGVDADGTSTLSLHDREGKPRVRLELKSDGSQGRLLIADMNDKAGLFTGMDPIGNACVQLLDKNETSRVLLGYRPKEDDSLISIQDDHRHGRLVMAMDHDEEMHLAALASDGSPRFLLRLSPDGDGMLGFEDKGKMRVRMRTTKNGASGIGFADADGKSVGSFGSDSVGESMLLVGDGNIQLRTKKNGSSGLHFFDSQLKRKISLSVSPDGNPLLLLQDPQGTTLFKQP